MSKQSHTELNETLPAWAARLERGRRWAIQRRSILAFAALVATLGAFNAWGALRTFEGLMGPIMAAVVIVAEYLAATLALDAEKAWREGSRSARAKAIVCALIAGGVFAPLNVWGTHRAVEAAFAPSLEAQRVTAQANIDSARAELQGRIASLDARIETQEARLDAIPTDIYGSRQEIRQRPIADRLATLEHERRELLLRLDATATVAEAPPLPLPDWLVWLGGVMLEIAKLLGVWAVALAGAGVANVSAAAAAMANKRHHGQARTSYTPAR